jgi:hypothetical protein
MEVGVWGLLGEDFLIMLVVLGVSAVCIEGSVSSVSTLPTRLADKT